MIAGKTARGRVYQKTPLADRFWPRVDKRGPADCWLWLGAKSVGYGSIRGYDEQTVMTHVVSWTLAGNPKPPLGYEVCHTCDVRVCVNPAHLFLGTRADNMQDAARKGRLLQQRHPERMPHGSKHHQAKLTEDAVREIRATAKAGGTSYRAIAARHGVSDTLVSMIVRRLWWRHVEE